MKPNRATPAADEPPLIILPTNGVRRLIQVTPRRSQPGIDSRNRCRVVGPRDPRIPGPRSRTGRGVERLGSGTESPSIRM